uniref:F-box domain-containing protein n=1 Tax=Kalanchoe fedtschenkoi TaxID=63787 RepID=A0A7N0TRK1_KALFE
MDSAVAGYPRGSEQLCRDSIREILLKLPVKALVRFKQVSKTWMRIIKSNRFAAEHCRYSAAKNRSGDDASFYVTRSKWTCADETKRTLFVSNVSVKRGGGHECKIHETMPMPRFSKYNRVYTYSQMFPAGSSRSSLARRSSPAAILFHVRIRTGDSSSTGSWRLITAYESTFPFYAPWQGVNLRDAVHILVVNDVEDYHITTFDYVREEFGRMEVPDAPQLRQRIARWRAHLTLFDDDRFLCLIFPWVVNEDEDSDNVFLDVWVMREYGSWSKECTVGPVSNRTAYVKNHSKSVGGLFLESLEPDGDPRDSGQLWLSDCASSAIQNLSVGSDSWGDMQVMERIDSLVRIRPPKFQWTDSGHQIPLVVL